MNSRRRSDCSAQVLLPVLHVPTLTLDHSPSFSRYFCFRAKIFHLPCTAIFVFFLPRLKLVVYKAKVRFVASAKDDNAMFAPESLFIGAVFGGPWFRSWLILEQWQWVWEVSVEKLPSDSLVEHNRSCLSSIFLGDIEGVWRNISLFVIQYCL